jgi:hypothetical protein
MMLMDASFAVNWEILEIARSILMCDLLRVGFLGHGIVF